MTAAEAGARSGPVRVLARAKVNLFLHVTGRRADGYHLIDSLAVFPELGDELAAVPAPPGHISLGVGGPFAAALGPEADNLVLRAARGLAALHPGHGARLVLGKHLPVASGIGGGSADAAAAIRALEALWGVATPGPARAALALSLGADVPACLADRPVRMGGIGEALAPAPPLPPFALVLANPRVEVETRAVFGALGGVPAAAPAPELPALPDAEALARWLAPLRNDLAAPAEALCPAIAEVRAALAADPCIRLARMSGSGATVFGIAADAAGAARAAARLRARHPGWWVAAAAVRP